MLNQMHEILIDILNSTKVPNMHNYGPNSQPAYIPSFSNQNNYFGSYPQQNSFVSDGLEDDPWEKEFLESDETPDDIEPIQRKDAYPGLNDNPNGRNYRIENRENYYQNNYGEFKTWLIAF
jgi:hypothetical protein